MQVRFHLESTTDNSKAARELTQLCHEQNLKTTGRIVESIHYLRDSNMRATACDPTSPMHPPPAPVPSTSDVGHRQGAQSASHPGVPSEKTSMGCRSCSKQHSRVSHLKKMQTVPVLTKDEGRDPPRDARVVQRQGRGVREGMQPRHEAVLQISRRGLSLASLRPVPQRSGNTVSRRLSDDDDPLILHLYLPS